MDTHHGVMAGAPGGAPQYKYSRSPFQNKRRVTQKPGYQFNKKYGPLCCNSQQAKMKVGMGYHQLNMKDYREVSHLSGSLKPLSL